MAAAGGTGLVAYGGWMIYPPLAYIIPGIALLAFAIITALRG